MGDDDVLFHIPKGLENVTVCILFKEQSCTKLLRISSSYMIIIHVQSEHHTTPGVCSKVAMHTMQKARAA